MNHKYLILIGAVIFATVMIALAGSGIIMAQGQGNCSGGECWKSAETSGPFEVSAPEGMVVSQVWIKTGMATGGCLLFTEDTSACYSISGIGTGSVSVSKIGSGSECQDISHIEVCYKAAPVNPIDDETNGPIGGEEVTPVTPVVGGVTTTPAAESTTAAAAGSLPVTGFGVIASLAGAVMAGTGFWLSRRHG